MRHVWRLILRCRAELFVLAQTSGVLFLVSCGSGAGSALFRGILWIP